MTQMTQTLPAGQARNPHAGSLAIITSLFFLFGFLTCLNDTLVPHLKALFTLSYTQANLVQFAFFGAYFLMSIPSSRICEKLGYQRGLVIGLSVTALGAFGFLASSHFVSFELFLLALFVLASGITLIQVAANPYVTLLGPAETGSARLTLVQAFNSLGTTIAPLFGSFLILSSTEVSSVEKPYLGLGIVLVLITLFIAQAKLPFFKGEASEDAAWSELFSNRRLMLGCLAIFAYVGGEVSIGGMLVNYIGSDHVLSLAPAIAGRYVSIYWGSAMVGRFVGTPLLTRYSPARVLQGATVGSMLMVALSLVTTGSVAMGTILAVGLFNSIMFPTIFSQAISGLSRGTEKASGLLCTAIVGGALVPLAQGMIADRAGLTPSFVMPILCYAYVTFFATRLVQMDRKAI
jgi:FHS family L-fucose permease-like MFS transporter